MWKPALLTMRRPQGLSCLARIQEWSNRWLFRLLETRLRSSQRVELVRSCSGWALPCAPRGHAHVRRLTGIQSLGRSGSGHWGFSDRPGVLLGYLQSGISGTPASWVQTAPQRKQSHRSSFWSWNVCKSLPDIGGGCRWSDFEVIVLLVQL